MITINLIRQNGGVIAGQKKTIDIWTHGGVCVLYAGTWKSWGFRLRRSLGRNLSFYLVFYRWFCCFGFGGGMAGKTQIKNILEKLKNVLAFLVIMWYNKENREKRITL